MVVHRERALLRQLVAPVIAYEQYPHTDGELPLHGLTWTAGEDLRTRRDALARRRRTLARLREAAVEAPDS